MKQVFIMSLLVAVLFESWFQNRIIETERKCVWYYNINKALKIVVIIIINLVVVMVAVLVTLIYFIAANKNACIYENPFRNYESD